MTTREKMARAMYERQRKQFASPLAWEDQTPLTHGHIFQRVDAALDVLLEDPGHDVTAVIVDVMEDRAGAVARFHQIIRAIKEGK